MRSASVVPGQFLPITVKNVGVRPPEPDELALAPRERLAALARLVGAQQAADVCREVLEGDRDDAAVLWLGGQPAASWRYEPWPRTWALRGLLYVWDDAAEAAVLAALTDEAWRVREMAAKVVCKRELPSYHLLEPLLRDPLPRVRVAGLRAVAVVGEAESADAVLEALEDGDGDVRRVAAGALARLERRLDRRLGS